MSNSFHINYIDPSDVWPQGAWSVYRINGDQIADRIVRAEICRPPHGPAYYKGEVIARHSWCGYIGMFTTMAEATAAIEQQEKVAA